MENVGHVKERLGRHTAAKDTETPEVAGTVDDGGAETEETATRAALKPALPPPRMRKS